MNASPKPGATLAALAIAARTAAGRAYAPYSEFRVGAAVRAASGLVYAGCNVENASFGLTCCAERNAIFAAIAAGETAIDTVVVYTPTSQPTAPCGACRQVIAEFGPGAEIVAVCDGPEQLRSSLPALLPAGFGKASLRPR